MSDDTPIDEQSDSEMIDKLQKHIEDVEYFCKVFRQAYFCWRFLMRLELSQMYINEEISKNEEQEMENLDIFDIFDNDESNPVKPEHRKNQSKKRHKKCDLSYT